MEVEVIKNGPVTTVVLYRPEVKNAVDGPTAQALEDAFKDFDADPEARVAVFYGEGGTFCAGADLKAMVDPKRRNRLNPEGEGPMGPSRLLLNKPVIAAIEGYAVAGGLELSLWCDMRVIADDGIVGVFCRRWGVPLIDGGTVRLPRLIGHSRAMDLILTGRPVTAAEALGMGLVNRVVPAGEARKEAETLARQIAAFPQACMKSDRLSAYGQWDLSLEQALIHEGRCAAEVMAAEGNAGAAAFSAGRGRHGLFEDES